jgi:hypothetical protein
MGPCGPCTPCGPRGPVLPLSALRTLGLICLVLVMMYLAANAVPPPSDTVSASTDSTSDGAMRLRICPPSIGRSWTYGFPPHSGAAYGLSLIHVELVRPG